MPEFSSTTDCCLAKKARFGSPFLAVVALPARCSIRLTACSGVTCSNCSPEGSTCTSGPSQHSFMQPTSQISILSPRPDVGQGLVQLLLDGLSARGKATGGGADPQADRLAGEDLFLGDLDQFIEIHS